MFHPLYHRLSIHNIWKSALFFSVNKLNVPSAKRKINSKNVTFSEEGNLKLYSTTSNVSMLWKVAHTLRLLRCSDRLFFFSFFLQFVVSHFNSNGLRSLLVTLIDLQNTYIYYIALIFELIVTRIDRTSFFFSSLWNVNEFILQSLN